MTAGQIAAAERRDAALRDLVELAAQVDAGEIDHDTAVRLRRTYEAEAAAALRRLEQLEAAPGQPSQPPRRRCSRRALGVGATVAVLAVAVLVLPRFVGERPEGGFVTGNEAVAGGRDLASVTNAEMEEVVADNPDVVPMRLRLAHRYLDDGDYAKAVDHYMAVLDREAHPEALSHLGWIVFNDGDADLAAELLEASRERSPDDPEMLWFLANVRLYGQDRPGDAIELLDRLAATGATAPAQRDQIEAARQDAHARQEVPR